MSDYLSWLNGYEYLINVPVVHIMVLYMVLGLVAFRFKLAFVRQFLHDKSLAERSAREQLHGPIVRRGAWFSVVAVTVGPVVEEILFRGPILWFLLQGEYAVAAGLVPLTAVVFSLSHLSGREKYADGSRLWITKTTLAQIGFAGFLYGVLTLVTASLWPAIFSHISWNTYVLFVVYPRLRRGRPAQPSQATQRS